MYTIHDDVVCVFGKCDYSLKNEDYQIGHRFVVETDSSAMKNTNPVCHCLLFEYNEAFDYNAHD